MSRDDDSTRGALVERLARALREHTGLGASFFSAAAARLGMPVTDLQVLDSLDSGGLTTAGQLAEQAGLTTGAITGMLNRLEEAGLVRRERDPNDGRKVIVRLAPGRERMGEVHTVFESAGAAWEELAAGYDDEQLALVVAFLERGNALTRRSVADLRAKSGAAPEGVSAPLGDTTSGHLFVSYGMYLLTLRAADGTADLYQAHFTGPNPEVKVRGGAVTIRYPRRLPMMAYKDRTADVMLNPAIPWQIELQGNAAEINADLGRLTLTGLDVKGNASMINLGLPAAATTVPVRVMGSASVVNVRRPAGVPVRAHLKGWVSTFTLDGQRFSDMGNDVRLQSPDAVTNEPGYDIEVSSSASTVSIATD